MSKTLKKVAKKAGGKMKELWKSPVRALIFGLAFFFSGGAGLGTALQMGAAADETVKTLEQAVDQAMNPQAVEEAAPVVPEGGEDGQ